MINELHRFLTEFFANSELNRLHENYGGGRIFSNPLLGVARGDDQSLHRVGIAREYLL